jgi:hypothetical protein
MELILGLVFLGIILILSIVGIAVWHTQRMAELNGPNRGPSLDQTEIDSMKRELKELRQMITSLAINVENMKDNYVHSSALEDRIRVGE